MAALVLAWSRGPGAGSLLVLMPLALAHAGSGVSLFLDERFAEARAALETATGAAAAATPREQGHVRALALLVTGRVADAEQAMHEHLDAYPRDVVVFQRLYFIWFWQGRFPEMLGFTTRLAPRYPGDSFMLGMHPFALEQADRCDEAVRVAEAAIDPCVGLGWFRNHLLWHLTLIHLSRGDYARASRLSRTVFERAPSSIAGELHDSISLLWRLELAGVPVGERWRPFVEIARSRLNRQGLLFHSAHLAMALAAGGDWTTAETQLAGLRELAPKDRTGLVGDVLVPLVDGLHAFARGEWRRAIERIEPLASRVVELGGSRAQRDVFHDTLLEACFRAGDMDRAERLLAARVARRPDHVWLTRRSRAAA